MKLIEFVQKLGKNKRKFLHIDQNTYFGFKDNDKTQKVSITKYNIFAGGLGKQSCYISSFDYNLGAIYVIEELSNYLDYPTDAFIKAKAIVDKDKLEKSIPETIQTERKKFKL